MHVLCGPDGEGLPVFLCQGASSLCNRLSPIAFSSLCSSRAPCLCPRAQVTIPSRSPWPGSQSLYLSRKDSANLVCGDDDGLQTLPSGRRGGLWDSHLGGRLSTSPTTITLGRAGEHRKKNVSWKGHVTMQLPWHHHSWWVGLSDGVVWETLPTYASEPNKLTGPTTKDCGTIVLFVISLCPAWSKQIHVPISPGEVNQTILEVTS